MVKAVRYSRFGGPEVLEIVDLPDPHVGPGQIRVAVHAVGVNPTDWKLRKGLMGGELPQTTGREVAGVVDEVGEGVTDVAVGDRVFGFSADGEGAAELALLADYAPIPRSLGFAEAAGLPVAIETATRTLDALGVEAGSTLLVNGAAGGVGSAAVLCPQCGEAFTKARAFREHYLALHPDAPFPESWDSPELDAEFRSWGGSDPTDSQRPANVFEGVMEEPPEDT